LAISDITLLELTTLASKGRIHPDISLESFLREVETRFVVLPITGRACVRVLGLPADYPQDPADRMIGATALAIDEESHEA
jgi:PIN domain nuclease of toxin-antitoxin system